MVDNADVDAGGGLVVAVCVKTATVCSFFEQGGCVNEICQNRQTATSTTETAVEPWLVLFNC